MAQNNTTMKKKSLYRKKIQYMAAIDLVYKYTKNSKVYFIKIINL